MTPQLEKAFWTIHAGLPRQAPGSTQSTKTLLDLANLHTSERRALDIGCGPGRSALVLAENNFTVTALDTSDLLLRELQVASEKAGLSNRITTQNGSLFDMPFRDGSFDLVWAEGSAYIAGWHEATRDWQRLLAQGGKLVATECCWLTNTPSQDSLAFWNENYPTMLTVGQATEVAQKNGLVVEATYTLPDSDWWDEYYQPLEERFATLSTSSDPAIRQVIAFEKAEINLRKTHAADYGYVGFILSPIQNNETAPAR